MEPIKIVDKLTLRQEALRMALINMPNRGTEYIQKDAEVFEEYLRGNANLDDFIDHNESKKLYMETLAKLQEGMKPNPWISVNDKMKPADGVCVLCALKYDSIVYEVMSYSNEFQNWQGGRSEDDTNHVVAWMFIPEYK